MPAATSPRLARRATGLLIAAVALFAAVAAVDVAIAVYGGDRWLALRLLGYALSLGMLATVIVRVTRKSADDTDELLSRNIDLQTARHQLEGMLDNERKNEVELAKNVLDLERAQKELREINARMAREKAVDEAMLGSIGDGVVATDDKAVILFMNASAKETLLWDPKTMIGKSLPEISLLANERGEHIGFDQHPMHLALTTGKKIVSKKFYFLRKDGLNLAVYISATPVLVDGKVIGAIEVFRDITQEKLIDQAKSEFVSLASHQLRTPLSTIGWYAEMLLSGDAGRLPKEAREYVLEISTSNKRMVDLVSSLLNVSRIDLGTFAVEPVQSRFEDIVQEVVKEAQPQIAQNKTELKTTVDSSIGQIMLDPRLMHMVFQNLLSNAVKYSGAGGKVAISVRKTADHIELSVADNGMGIPKSQQGKIFTKLFRADNAREKVTDGNGLGLYIVKAIAEQSGGKAWFVSEEDRGTTFFVSLPLAGMQPKTGSRALS